ERARDPRGTEILHAGEQAFVLQLEARFDEELLGERVADLHRRTLRLRAFLELLRSEDGRTTDPVASRLRADEHGEIAGGPWPATQDLLILEHADAHRVDERIARV